MLRRAITRESSSDRSSCNTFVTAYGLLGSSTEVEFYYVSYS